jgi:hypothetical protein
MRVVVLVLLLLQAVLVLLDPPYLRRMFRLSGPAAETSPRTRDEIVDWSETLPREE